MVNLCVLAEEYHGTCHDSFLVQKMPKMGCFAMVYHSGSTKKFLEKICETTKEGFKPKYAYVVKCYLCRSLNFRIGKVRFKNGCYVTNDPEQQTLIEGHRYYGNRMFGFQVELLEIQKNRKVQNELRNERR